MTLKLPELKTVKAARKGEGGGVVTHPSMKKTGIAMQ